MFFVGNERGRRIEEAPHLDYPTEDLHLCRVGNERFEVRVLRVQFDSVLAQLQPFDRRLILDQSHDDLARVSSRLPLHDDDVPWKDRRVPHALASYPESKQVFAGLLRLNGDESFGVFDGGSQLTGLHVSHQRLVVDH